MNEILWTMNDIYNRTCNFCCFYISILFLFFDYHRFILAVVS